MRVLITAGGTREPVDAVRVLANSSTGRLGVCIAEAAAVAGHEVMLLRSETAVEPDREAGKIEMLTFVTSSDLAGQLSALVPRSDAVVHAAAVSDYIPVRAEGKLSSDAPEMLMRLRRAPKLIDDMRALNPGAVLVGFKLTSILGEEERVEVARRLLSRARLDLVVANDVRATGPDDHVALLVRTDGDPRRCTGKRKIAAAVLEAVIEVDAARIASL